MATIYIENQPYEVQEGQNLLHACLSLGFDIPYFCWHPALNSVGACRQCAIKQFKDESDTHGRIVMACMTPATEGMRISIEDPEVREFRRQALELLMVNHPHDCPICDEGGECHLQDMTVMTGHTYRRFRFRKRTHRNQYLGPFVNHEMNRCIACYRCVRFYREVAGGRDLGVLDSHNEVYFGRHQDGVLESEFAGNLVEICPTGVFTDKTFMRHYTRKWDLQTAPSICVHCGLGCNTIPGERYGLLRRVRNRFHHEVNGYFLCDRGRFGYEFVNSERRLRRPLRRTGESDADESVSAESALEYVGGLLASGASVIGIGSPRASLEGNFALRELVGAENFYRGASDNECALITSALDILREGPARSPSLREVGEADAAFILGEDVTNTAALLALRLREDLLQQDVKIAGALHIPDWDDTAVREVAEGGLGPVFTCEAIDEAGRSCKATIFLATPYGTPLDDAGVASYHAAPADLARLGFAVAHRLDPAAPDVDLPPEAAALAEQIAGALREAEHPLVISGFGCDNPTIVQAAANVAWALCAAGREPRLCFTMPQCNSLGLALLGGPGISAALEAVREGRGEVVLILENDLFRRESDARIAELLGLAKHVVALDHLQNRTTRAAEVVLPVATFAESQGTLVNNEGRAQRFYPVIAPEGEVQTGWRWLRDLGRAAGREGLAAWQTADDLTAALAVAVPAFAEIAVIAPPAGFRAVGQRIPRQPHRYSGRTAMSANLSVHEPPPPADPDAPLSFSMEGFHGQPPAALTPEFWAPGWNSPSALNKFQEEVGGPLRGGEAGRRLLEPRAQGTPGYFTGVPEAFVPRPGEWLFVAMHHLFGSEELSAAAPAIAELAPEPYLGMNPADAERLALAAGAEVEVTVGDVAQRYPVRLIPALPEGVVGLPVGLPGLRGIDLPQRGKIAKS
jgi:NADH-quinone oxidoreductase subunit G